MEAPNVKLNHDHIFQVYKELKRILPVGYLKMKVLEKQRYQARSKKSDLEELEINNRSNLHNRKHSIRTSSFSKQNINIFNNEEYKNLLMSKREKLNNNNNSNLLSKNKKSFPYLTKNISNLQEKSFNNNNESKDSTKINIITNNTTMNNSPKISSYQSDINIMGDNINTYECFRDKNLKSLGILTGEKTKRKKGIYNSFAVNDIDMKSNIYLPRIIDRMKYKIPRNQRQYEGFLITGKGVKNLFYKENNTQRNSVSVNYNKYLNIKDFFTPKYMSKKNINQNTNDYNTKSMKSHD